MGTKVTRIFGILKLFCRECLGDILLTMAHAHLDAELLVDVLCQVLRTIDGTMLTARAAEGEHERREAALDVASP